MASDNMKHRRLQELDESDFEIVEGQPDIRGWDVKDSNSETIGEVDELILDAQARKVRYMVVDLDKETTGVDRTVLIPIGLAQLHEKDDDVLLPGVSIAQLNQLPEYDRDHLNDAVERSIASVMGRSNLAGSSSGTDDASFYEHEHFNNANLYQRRLLPPSTTAQSNMRDMRLQEKTVYSETKGGVGNLNPSTSFGRGTERSSTYSENVEEESLQTVGKDRSNPETDYTSNTRQEDPSEGFGREQERRSREDSSDRDRDLL